MLAKFRGTLNLKNTSIRLISRTITTLGKSSDEDMTETEPMLPIILEVKLMPPKRKWSIDFSDINDVLNFSKQYEPYEGLGMATHKKPNFEGSLFVLNTPMLENQGMSQARFEYFDQTNRDPENKSEEA
jgi:hypothetical protein